MVSLSGEMASSGHCLSLRLSPFTNSICRGLGPLGEIFDAVKIPKAHGFP